LTRRSYALSLRALLFLGGGEKMIHHEVREGHEE